MKIEISGENFSLKQLEEISKYNATVVISNKALQISSETRKIIDHSVESDQPVYGVTTSVGAFKDCRVSSENIGEFNNNMLRAHHFAIGDTFSPAEVRSAMVLRLNTALTGHAGIHPDLMHAIKNMLDHNILPEVRKIGSVGCADLGQMGQIGAAIVGEGYVNYNNQRMSAKDALNHAGLKPYSAKAKDGISLVSSNAPSIGRSALLISQAFRLFYLSFAAYGLTSAGFAASRQPWVAATKFKDGNIPDLAEFALNSFKNDLWRNQNIVHDPLSYRCAIQVYGTALETLIHNGEVVRDSMNSSDDNPIIVDEEMLTSGRSLPFRLAMSLQSLLLDITHISRNSLSRIIALGKSDMSGLSRNLTPNDGKVLGFGPSVKQAAELYAAIVNEANPASITNVTIADGMEDEMTFMSLIIQKLERQLDLWGKMIAHEGFVARQAYHLRKQNGDRLNGLAGELFKRLEHKIPPIDKDNDRIYSSDFILAEEILIDDEWIEQLAKDYPFSAWEKGRT